MYVSEVSNESFFSLLISTHEIFNTSDSTMLKFNYSAAFVPNTTLIYKYEYNEYEYNVDIKLITFEICLIHTLSDS